MNVENFLKVRLQVRKSSNLCSECIAVWTQYYTSSDFWNTNVKQKSTEKSNW